MDWLAAMVEASQLGAFARGSSWAYPAANLIHLLGLVLLVGGIGIVDLRLIGLFPALPLGPLVRALTPLALAGLTLIQPDALEDVSSDLRGDRSRLQSIAEVDRVDILQSGDVVVVGSHAISP